MTDGARWGIVWPWQRPGELGWDRAAPQALGSINLTRPVCAGAVDWQRLGRVVRLATTASEASGDTAHVADPSCAGEGEAW